MAAGLLVIAGAQPSRDRNGRAVSAQLRFYLASTTTPAVVFQDNALTVPHPFPILSDDAGRFPLIWADTTATFTVNWATADGQDKTSDGISATVGADQILLLETTDALNAALALYGGMEAVQAAVAASAASATAADARATDAQGSATASANSATAAAASAASITTGGYVRNTRAIGVGGLATGGGDLSADRTITVTAATHTDISAGTSTSTVITPEGLSFGLSAVNSGFQGHQAKSAAFTAQLTDKETFFDCTGSFLVSFSAAGTLGSKWGAYFGNVGAGIITLGSLAIILPGEAYFVSCDATALYAKRIAFSGAPDVVAVDQKASNTAAQTGTLNANTKRDLNTLTRNNGSVGSLASNQLTLPAGTWRLRCSAPGSMTGGAKHQASLFNETDAVTAVVGTSEGGANGCPFRSTADVVVTIAASKAFSVQTYSTGAVTALGIPANTGSPETYTILEAWHLP